MRKSRNIAETAYRTEPAEQSSLDKRKLRVKVIDGKNQKDGKLLGTSLNSLIEMRHIVSSLATG